MAISVLVVLAVLWAGFFLWPLLQGRTSSRRADSVADFSHRLGVIGKTGGHHLRRRPRPTPIAVVPPMPAVGMPPRSPSVGLGVSSRAQRRRRDVLLVLAVAVVSTLLLAVMGGTPAFWGVQLLADALLAGYVVLLVRLKQASQDHHTKVRYLPAHAAAPSTLALRRTASS